MYLVPMRHLADNDRIGQSRSISNPHTRVCVTSARARAIASLVSSLVAPDTLNGAVVTTAELANREISCRPIAAPLLVAVVLTMLFAALVAWLAVIGVPVNVGRADLSIAARTAGCREFNTYMPRASNCCVVSEKI